MNSLSLRAPALSALFAAAAVWLPAVNAAAQDCAADADCGDGYRCQHESYESCGGAITCTPDGECTESDGGCSTVSYAYCTHATCTVDADCPSTMACQAQTSWQCSGGGAAGRGGDGAMDPTDAGTVDEPYECVEVPADSLCIPRYQLACTVASDCGGGFDCVQSTNWECSGGSAGSGGPAGGMGGEGGAGSTMPPVTTAGDADGGVEPSYDCHEVPGTASFCQLQDLPCTATDECPDGLLCLEQYIWSCSGGGAGAGAGGSGGSIAGAGGASPMPTDSADVDAGASDGSSCSSEVQQRCMPRDYGGGGSMSGGGGTTGGAADGGVAMDPGDTTGGSAGAFPPTAGGGGAAGGEPEEDDDSGDEGGHGHGHGHGHHFGWLNLGCSAGGPIGSDPSGWLALGMTVLVLRRRARKLN